MPALSVNRENSCLKTQEQPLYVIKKGQNLPEAVKKNYLPTLNEFTDTLRLSAIKQRVQKSIKAVTKSWLEAQRENTIMIESEKEHIHQV